MCKPTRGALWYVLSSCGGSLPINTWCHNRVLVILAELNETQWRVASEQPTQDLNPYIGFLQREARTWHASKPYGQKLTTATRSWKMASELKEALHTRITSSIPRNNQALWYGMTQSGMSSLLNWLYLGGEHGRSLREEETLLRESMHRQCKGWLCQVIPIQVGWRGFIGRTTTSYLTRFGVINRVRWRPYRRFKQPIPLSA